MQISEAVNRTHQLEIELAIHISGEIKKLQDNCGVKVGNIDVRLHTRDTVGETGSTVVSGVSINVVL